MEASEEIGIERRPISRRQADAPLDLHSSPLDESAGPAAPEPRNLAAGPARTIPKGVGSEGA